MGTVQSTLSGPLTRAELLKQTAQPRNLINFLFNYFANQIGQKDILSLANPQRCTDYVFVMADALNSIFIDLRIEPGKDKNGVIFFRKIKDLAQAEPGSPEAYRKRIMCISVAFFYIRIFQIYAALALSVNDDMPYSHQQFGDRRPITAPGLETFIQDGGVLYENIKKFNILKKYLSKDLSRQQGTFYFDRYPNLSLNINTQKENLSIYKSSQIINGPIVVSCRFNIRPSPSDVKKVLLVFDNFTSTESVYNESLKSNGPLSYFITQYDDEYYKSDKTNETVDDLIFRVMSSAREVAMRRRVPNKARVRVTTTTTTGQPIEVGVIDGLKTSQLVSSLKRVPKPLAHCVARSLQLLNIDALATSKLPAEVRTSICKVKFDESQGGIPDIGQPITTAPGISALHQLFFDKIISGKPDMSQESLSSYQTFVKTMATQFAEGSAPSIVHLGSVVNRADKLCLSTTISKRDKILTVRDPNAISMAQKAVQFLWKTQIEHDKKVIEILSKLIVITKVPGGKKINLHPLILKTGNPGLAIIAKEARELLIQYYSNCERAFRIAGGPLGVNGTSI